MQIVVENKPKDEDLVDVVGYETDNSEAILNEIQTSSIDHSAEQLHASGLKKVFKRLTYKTCFGLKFKSKRANMLLHFPNVRGCITQEKYIKGRTLAELESTLGFHAGRLAQGATVLALLQVPNKHQFQMLGYTQVAEHNISGEALKGLDQDKLKDLLVRETFTTVGINRLVKVVPKTEHSKKMSDDEQYPPGWGVPQWKLTAEMPVQVIADLNAGERYL